MVPDREREINETFGDSRVLWAACLSKSDVISPEIVGMTFPDRGDNLVRH